jgi:hypothetical protein
MVAKVHYYVLCIIGIAMLISCYPDDQMFEEEEPTKPCLMDVDSTITFDTIWTKKMFISRVRFFDEYFVTLDFDNRIHLYSASTGELLTQLDPSIFNYFYDISVLNDHVILKKNTFDDNRMHVYSILGKKYSAFELQQNYPYPKNYYTTDGTHLIMALDKVICSMDFEGNILDTLYDIRSLSTVDLIDNLRMYNSPPSLNRKYLIFTYNDIDKFNTENNVSYLIIYDLIAKKVHKKLAFTYIHWGSANFMEIRDHALLYMDQEKVLIYDFVSNRYYSRNQSNLSGTASPPVHIMPMNYDQNGEFNPLIFYNNPNLSAFDLKSANLKWTCENNFAFALSTVRLLRKNGNLDTYLLALNEGVDVIDPQTGVVKARFLEKNEKNSSGDMEFMSGADSENIFFASDQWKVYKLRVSVD